MVKVKNPSRAQVSAAKSVVEWYFEYYFGQAHDPGTLATFTDRTRVGHFCLDPARFARGEGTELFKLLIAVTMFQRRRDPLVLGLLRSFRPADARALTDAAHLLRLADGSRCEHLKSHNALLEHCSLAKDPASSAGVCPHRPHDPCHLKRHTELLLRYGDFGKYPTSAALLLREGGNADLAALFARVVGQVSSREARADELERAICGVHRVSNKLANMFLSLVSNPDLTPSAPWSSEIDWTRFIVIDSNVDAFLRSIGVDTRTNYESRRRFVGALSERIDLRTFSPAASSFNPRLVQQAFYVFMSRANRSASPRDCWRSAPRSCSTCASPLSSRCSLRVTET